MRVLAFLFIMAIVYFVVPIALSIEHITILQSAAITFLLIMTRVILTENITVKLFGVDELRIEEKERD